MYCQLNSLSAFIQNCFGKFGQESWRN